MSVVCLLFYLALACYGQANSAILPTTDPDPNVVRVRNALTEKIGNFSIEFLYHTSILQAPGQNMITSPITVWTALAVMYEGASGNTRLQIQESLRLSGNTTSNRINFAEMAKWLTVSPTDVHKIDTVELAKFNGIFVDKSKLPLPEFQEDSKKYYDTDTISLNFANAEVAKNNINGVISNLTHGRIPSIVDTSNFENTPMVLASALYFRGQWALPFNASSTSKQPFFDSNGTQIGEVNMMYNRANYPFSNIKKLQARVIELPYGKENRLSMLIMLPNYGISLESMFFNFQHLPLDAFFEELRRSREDFSDDEVDCFIPRFKIKSDLDLTEVLRQNMGIVDLFDVSKAFLPHMSRIPIYVSKLVHKAEIEVTEEGTTAAAVTVAEFSNRIGVVRFEANRPFTYVIVEKITNTIVFGGFYRQPSVY